MNNLRRWTFSEPVPFPLELAADFRLRPTDYVDDQCWEVLPGAGESPALALQTRYGGRAGLVSLVPMWVHEGRPIYQTQAYAVPPSLTHFAPGYLCLQAAITPHIALQAEYWALDSHSVGASFTLTNSHAADLQIQLDLIGFVGSQQKEQKTATIPLPPDGIALALGTLANIQPVVVLEGAAAALTSSSGKISRALTIPKGGQIAVRFVHAALGSAAASLAHAQQGLAENWTEAFQRIDQSAAALPDFHTGDEGRDLLLAWSACLLVNAFFKPTTSLPYASLVATRSSGRGYSPRRDGSDYDRSWNGQSPLLAYPAALAIATTHPAAAQGVIRNFLALQQPDGWIDSKPGLGGQKQGSLCLPILARLTWGIFQLTEDAAFLRDVFPGLLKHFARWFQKDVDSDGDGLPEWQSEAQTGYVFTPTFATWQGWGQGADIRRVEAPDLAAYLLSEARSLKEIAYFLRDTQAEAQLDTRINALQTALGSLWSAEGGHFAYRDRDTHTTTNGQAILTDARGTDELLPAQPLTPPNRLIVKVAGGVNLTPRMTLKLDGLDANGAAISETTDATGFVWSGGRGVYTSQHVYAQIDRATFTGLSRAYRVDVASMDTTALDISALLPLWAGGIAPEQATATLARLTDSAHFWQPSGVSMNSARDARFDPRGASGSGAVWPYGVNLMGEALIEMGEMATAATLLERYLTALQTALKARSAFSEFLASDAPLGLGETHHLAGIAPLYLLLRSYGIRILSPTKVWAGGAYTWPAPVNVRQYGVLVKRNREGTRIEFPSGSIVEWANNEWREVVDQHG
jgi:hypothetical protein